MERFGIVIKVKREKLEEYKSLHANPWPEVVTTLRDHGLKNFSIYHKDEYLFGYFEYYGSDLESDLKKMNEIPIYSKWLSLTDPCQEPLASRHPGEWWASMEEIYHHD
ncbi:MAG: L-rhamnose mutarotase [Ignavibacteria bacterium]|nr:L-rhamnose mutarotase [Ignavibacteria bacterium]